MHPAPRGPRVSWAFFLRIIRRGGHLNRFERIVIALERVHLLGWIWSFVSPFAVWLFVPKEYLTIGWDKHPGLLITIALLIFVLSTALLAIIRKWLPTRALVSRLGAVLTASYPTEDPELAADFRESVRDQILDDLKSTSHLRILGATGYNTFAMGGKGWTGARSAFLYDILDSAPTTTEIDIVLMHPDSKFAKARAAQIGVDVNVFRDEILASIGRCVELRKAGKSVRCFLFHERPLVWKLIITDKHVWQQAYPVDGHVEYSGINLFRRRGNANSPTVAMSNSLYAPFLMLFDLLKGNGCKEVDLSTSPATIPTFP